MNSNYFTGLHLAHAVLKHWLITSRDTSAGTSGKSATLATKSTAPRHLIFTASFLSFFTFAGYAPYSPAKAALRSLSDTLSQEMNLYAAANPDEPRVRVHTIFPAGILSEGLENEQRIKTDLTKLLEEGDKPQTPEAIAAKSIQGLESGQEMITTDFQTGLVRRGMLGGSTRGGFARGFVDWFLAGWLAIIMVFVRGDMDQKVQKWGREFGASGMKENGASTRN
jgi:3-dehydrosphinganine reductase